MPLPSATRPRWPRVAVAVVVAVLALVACRWRPDTGFTALIRFGEAHAPHQLPEVRRLPLAIAPNAGYDGQFYAQLAVSPDLDRPELATAIPDLSYRARRILLPWLAHVAGAGRPWSGLRIYALLNVAAWLALAWIWARECSLNSGAGFARWATAMLALGCLDSVRLSLTDLPATLLIVLGVRAASVARPGLAAAWLALGGLVRETAVLAALRLQPSGRPASGDAAGRFRPLAASVKRWAWRFAIAAPILAWSLWLRLQFPDAPSNLAGNFDIPGAAFVRHLARCVAEIGAGNFDSRYTFGLIAALGLAGQSLYLLTHWRDANPWIRMAAPFAILFWFLGDYVWHGYWAVARICLPMSFAFIRTAPLGPGFALANLSLLHGVYRLLP